LLRRPKVQKPVKRMEKKKLVEMSIPKGNIDDPRYKINRTKYKKSYYLSDDIDINPELSTFMKNISMPQ
jgi:hypothetical protein